MNGDGSVRMIYDGTFAYANINNGGSTSYGIKRTIGTVNYYVGYMYNLQFSNYAEEWNVMNNKNATSSNLKTIVDNWFENNIFVNIPNSAKKYSDYLSADSIFCEDKNMTNTWTYQTDYIHLNNPHGSPTLSRFTCVNTQGTVDLKNDAFTVSNKGNGALTYPVGILTIDEAIAAGLWDTSSSPYLRSGYNNWAMTPSRYDEIDGGEFNTRFDDIVKEGHTSNFYGIRPVVSLSPKVTIKSGTDGTINNPYEIVYN